MSWFFALPPSVLVLFFGTLFGSLILLGAYGLWRFTGDDYVPTRQWGRPSPEVLASRARHRAEDLESDTIAVRGGHLRSPAWQRWESRRALDRLSKN